MAKLTVSYDALQHCTALKKPEGKSAAMDCPYTGKGEEFSPAEMVGSGLAGCMLISMGVLAMRNKIDISGTNVDIEIEQSQNKIERFRLQFTMARPYSEEERLKLERAAGRCPIKSSFHPDTKIEVVYQYPE